MQSTSFLKRQKELRRLEKQQEKQAKRAARATIKRERGSAEVTSAPDALASPVRVGEE